MPHLLFRNVSKEAVSEVSKTLCEDLAKTFDCDKADITFELVHSTSFINGEVVVGDATVDVKMFKRPKAVCDGVSNILTNFLSNGYSGDIAIIFEFLEPELYYENGNSF